MKHKLLSILLCLAMALSLLPTAALAEETGATENYVTLELVYGDSVTDDVKTAARAEYEGKTYDTCKAANEAYMALYGVGKNSDGVLDVVNNNAPLRSYVNNTAPVTEVKFHIHGTLAGFTSLLSAGNQIDCTVGGNHQIARTSISIIGVDGSDGSKAKLTDGNVQAYVAGGYDNMYTDSGKLTIDNIEFTTTNSTTVAASAANATIGSTKTATGEMEIKNCKFNGRLYVYDNFENTRMTYNIHDNVFDGTNYSGDSNAYPIFAQCRGGNELIIKNNNISGFARGINIDHANIKATIDGNTISVTDTGRSCIQLSSLTTADIKGNTLNLTGGNAITLHEKLLKLTTAPEVSITDNTITGTGYLIYDDAAAHNESFTSDKLTLTMGTDESANKIADTVDTTKGVKDGNPTALTGYVAAALAPAAAINGVGYATLAEAITAAQDGDTITLLKDCSSERVDLDDKCITIDLNGNILTSTSAYGVMFCAKNGHKITVNGTKEGSKLVGTLMVTTGTDGHIEINGGTYESSQYCPIYINGAVSSENSTLTVKNATITASNSGSNQDMGCGVYLAGYSTSVFENTAITAPVTGIEIRAGKLTLKNCTVTGGNETVTTKANGNGTTVTNAALAISQHTTKKPIDVTINGGTFTGKASVYQTDVQNTGSANVKASVKNGNFNGMVSGETNGTIAVSGGTFSSAVPENCCAPGFVPTQSGSTYGVKINENMAAEVLDAQRNTVGAYNTLAEAINAAGNGDTVTLLKDVTENVTIPAGKTITLDLNGKTINGKQVKSTPALTVNGSVTVKDSSEAKTGTIKREDTAANSGVSSHYVIDIQGENASLTFESGNVTNGSGIVGVKGASLVRVGNDEYKDKIPTLTIKGGKFTQDNFIAIKVDYGTLNVTGGEINSANSYAIENWKEANVTGGTINGAVASWTYSGGADSTTTISGGTINGSVTSVNYGNATGKKATVNISGNAIVNGNLDTRSYNPSTNELTSITDSGKATIAVSGGNFSQSVDKKYLDSSLNAELKRASGKTPYSYYTSVAAATAAAQPGDTVTDLNATTEQKVTLTLKYNDGATADTTYNVASGTTITLPTPKRSGYTFNGWYDGSKFYAAGASYKVSATATLNASWSYISSGSSSYDPTYSVSTPSKTKNGSVTVSPKSASKGDTVTVTVKPDSGYVLETLTVTDKNGNELTLKDKGNGKYTFTMPAGKVEVKATFMEDNSMLNFFYDVPNDAYFYEAVKWAVKNGITTGVGNDLFAPEQPCTRAQIVTFLWRAAGSPEPKGTAAGMTDVVSGSYYEKAVAWAIENGITTGTTTSTFSPDATCTRAQAVTFLARALNAKAASAAEFSDVPNDSYFADAVAWAAANGVTEGIGGGLFGSDNDCTRGQIVTFLYRAYNK